MFQFLFTPHSLRQLSKFTKRDQIRIKKKLHFWSKSGNTLEFAKPLANFEFATHRFRVGDYRIICKVKKKALIILVLKIGHRKNVYKK